MTDEKTPAHPPAEGWERERTTLGGDEFLNAVIQSVCGDDVEKREWARAMVEHENTVADFVASVRRALRAVREVRGLSIEAAAEQVGVSASTLARLEAGATAKADLKLVTRVALLLGVVPRLDFAARGSAAAVTLGGLETTPRHAAGFRDLDQPSLTVLPMSGADPPVLANEQDATALDRRIRDLEARIAAMEHPKPENGD